MGKLNCYATMKNLKEHAANLLFLLIFFALCYALFWVFGGEYKTY